MLTREEKFFQKQLNIYRLHELVDHIINGVANGGPFILSPALLCKLHGVAMQGLLVEPGCLRKGEVSISNSPHKPPSWVEVEAMVNSLCEYVNLHWQKYDLVYLASFVMWRLNYIHPFLNGNGRVSRAAAYLVLCCKFGKHLPAKNSIIEQILQDRQNYYHALHLVDAGYEHSKNIEASMEPLVHLMSHMLTEQLKANF